MKKQVLTIVVCVHILLASGSYAEAVQQLTWVESKGETVIVAKSAKLNVQVRITTHEEQIGKPSDQRPDVIRSSCTYSRYPCSIVDAIDIAVNDKAIIVPRSVFCDLADLSTAQIQIGQKESILTLVGGDASESYVVKIVFDAGRVKRRVKESGMLPGQPIQETTYHRRVIGD
jgi:hypothetical protein